MPQPDQQPATLCVHAGRRPQAGDSAVVTPIYQTSTFLPSEADYELVKEGRGFESRVYSRYGNPSVVVPELRIAALEGAEEARLFSSGNAAMHAVVMSTALPAGHVLAASKLYGGTRAQLDSCLQAAGGSVTYVDFDDRDLLRDAFQSNTRLLICESLANPTLEVADIPFLGELAHANNALLAVDATFATPIHQRPLELGADLVIHSASKYIGGHSDLIAGAVAGPGKLMSRVTSWRTNAGGCLDPHAAFLIDRGLKTLALRMAAHCSGASALAEFLESHEAVECVRHPSLESFPQKARAAELLSGMGGMLFFTLKGSDEDAAHLLSNLRLAVPAASLGGVETLVNQPALTSHAGMSESERTFAGIPPGSVRVSVGIEGPEDLIADFDQALSSLPQR
ncbi:MAG: cystathionine beta-lyase/cystathionine gamma-synthase [Planctomycetota bacterium]|jgi:cystathionine beta-lyase/cystathionine gamma-synthase